MGQKPWSTGAAVLIESGAEVDVVSMVAVGLELIGNFAVVDEGVPWLWESLDSNESITILLLYTKNTHYIAVVITIASITVFIIKAKRQSRKDFHRETSLKRFHATWKRLYYY